MSPEVLVASKRSFDRLSRDNQQVLRQAAKDSVPFMREQWARTEQEARRAVEAGGAQVSEADKEAFTRAVQPVYDQFVRDAKLKALVERVREAA
jgi:TRAP-type C4-dicarboxylate transport system substrate-binding protein